jgi:O-antigen ligase
MKEKLIYLFAFFMPLEQIVYQFTGIENELKPYRVFILLAVIIHVFQFVTSKKKFLLETKILLSILTYGFLIGFINIGVKEGNMSYLVNGSTHFFIGLLIFFIITSIKNKNVLNLLIKYFIAGLIVSCIYGFYSFAFSVSNLRFSGFFKNPNHLAFAINFITPVLFYQLIIKKNVKIASFLLLFFSLVVVLTGSRTGLLLQIINLFLFVLFIRLNIFKLSLIFLGGILTYFYIFQSILIQNNHFMNRFETENIQTGSGRLDILKGAFDLGLDTNFMGVGIQQYRFYHVKYLPLNPYGTMADFDLGTHNHYIDLLVNFGFVSLLLYLFILISFFKTFFKVKQDNLKKNLLLSLIILIIASFSQEMFVFPLFWLMLACLTHYKYQIKNYI